MSSTTNTTNTTTNTSKAVKAVKTGKVATSTWRDADIVDQVTELTRPAMINDVKSMLRGRTVWRRTSTITETMGRACAAISTIIAFASASDIAGDDISRILGFVAGSVGTAGLVLASFANFSRTQATERTDAANLVLKAIDVEAVPDVNDVLDISDGHE